MIEKIVLANPPELFLNVSLRRGEPAEAFAKGGDSVEHLGGVVPSPLS